MIKKIKCRRAVAFVDFQKVATRGKMISYVHSKTRQFLITSLNIMSLTKTSHVVL